MNNSSNLQQFSITSLFRTTFITLWFDNIEPQSRESSILIGGDAFEHVDGCIIDSEEIAVADVVHKAGAGIDIKYGRIFRFYLR